MITVIELTNRWTVVARRVRLTEKHDGWQYDMSPGEVSKLNIAVAHGSVTICERLEPDGSKVKVAKRAPADQRREGEAFAFAGRGLFEQ